MTLIKVKEKVTGRESITTVIVRKKTFKKIICKEQISFQEL